MTKVGLYAIGKSTTLESNKSHPQMLSLHARILRQRLYMLTATSNEQQ